MKFDLTLTPSFQKDSTAADKDWQELLADTESRDLGFFTLPDSQKYVDDCQAVLNKYKNKSQFVQIGIGGSSLGPKMLVTALTSKTTQQNISFWENIDSDLMIEEFETLDIEKTLFFVVSKSGGTAETLALLCLLLDKMQAQGITPDQYKNHLVVATGIKGDLLGFAKEHGLETLEVPENVGGRFSVLTPVGLLPAMFVGIDGKALIAGAKSCKESLLKDPSELINLSYELLWQREQKNVSQTIIMPYSSKLKELTAWFVQLWAESLGKKLTLDGKVVNTGLTPVGSVGAIDQHSQVQLFMEGPKDKFILFIEVEKEAQKLSLKNSIESEKCKLLSKFSLHDLMKAELIGTELAAKDNAIPTAKITIDKVDAGHLGSLIFYFETLTMLTGQKLNIDPFDQPGVEAGKIYAFDWLKNN